MIEMPLASAYERASRAMIESLEDDDAIEGMSAFLEKRAPSWRNG